jgi:hypothetical protein
LFCYCDSFFPKEKVAGALITFYAVCCRLSAEAFYIKNCGNRVDGLAQKDRDLFVFTVTIEPNMRLISSNINIEHNTLVP